MEDDFTDAASQQATDQLLDAQEVGRAFRQTARIAETKVRELEAVLSVECDCRAIEKCSRCEAIDAYVSGLPRWKTRLSSEKAEAILKSLTEEMSDYEDDAKPDELLARIRDLNRRRVAAEEKVRVLSARLEKS